MQSMFMFNVALADTILVFVSGLGFACVLSAIWHSSKG